MDALDGREKGKGALRSKERREALTEQGRWGDKVLQGAVEIEEGLGRHRDCEERDVERG